MAARSDHERRDAEHAAGAEIAIEVTRYIRRIQDEAKKLIQEDFLVAERENRPVDGTAIGRTAGRRATAFILGVNGPNAIEGETVTPEIAA